MVLIYGQRSDILPFELRETLLLEGIPCALVGPEFGFASLVDRVHFVIFTSIPDHAALSFRKNIPLEKVLEIEDEPSVESVVRRVKLCYFQRFGFDFEYAEGAELRFSDKRIYFRGHELHLTKTERLIVRFLFEARDEYFSSDEICAGCFLKKGTTVAGHISAINKKARYMTEIPLILTKRNRGYRIP